MYRHCPGQRQRETERDREAETGRGKKQRERELAGRAKTSFVPPSHHPPNLSATRIPARRPFAPLRPKPRLNRRVVSIGEGTWLMVPQQASSSAGAHCLLVAPPAPHQEVDLQGGSGSDGGFQTRTKITGTVFSELTVAGCTASRGVFYVVIRSFVLCIAGTTKSFFVVACVVFEVFFARSSQVGVQMCPTSTERSKESLATYWSKQLHPGRGANPVS